MAALYADISVSRDDPMFGLLADNARTVLDREWKRRRLGKVIETVTDRVAEESGRSWPVVTIKWADADG